MQIIGYKNITERDNRRSICIPIIKNEEGQLCIHKINPYSGLREGQVDLQPNFAFKPANINSDILTSSPYGLIIYEDWNGRLKPYTYLDFLKVILREFSVKEIRPDPYFFLELSYFLQVPQIVENQFNNYNHYLEQKGIKNSASKFLKYSELEKDNCLEVLNFYLHLIDFANWDIEKMIVFVKDENFYIGKFFIPLVKLEAFKTELGPNQIEALDKLLTYYDRHTLTKEQHLHNKYRNDDHDIHDAMDAIQTELKIAYNEREE